MSTDTLAALLEEGLSQSIGLLATRGQPEQLSAWLQARGVVILPPDHPLRTLQGDLIRWAQTAREEALRSKGAGDNRDVVFMSGMATAYEKAAELARAALAVLREGA